MTAGGAEADARSLPTRLRARIAADGPITVEAFMRACLLDQHAGVYAARQPVGGEGDFITAPEISQMFGELIGLWVIAVWQSMGSPSPVTVVELGPGRGTLIADAMRSWRVTPQFYEAARVTLVEPAGAMIEIQKRTLAGTPVAVTWCADLGQVESGPLILIANEVLDAMPIRQFVRREGSWRERVIGMDDNDGFVFLDGPQIDLRSGAAPEGAIVEVRPESTMLLQELARRATEHPVAALFIDYGHEESGFGDTLQAVRRHRFAEPLHDPGESDLSAQVDFAALMREARELGLRPYGPMPQGEFLLKLGLGARRDQLMANADPHQRAAIASGARRLADPEQMGILFKVMATTSSGLPAPPPFPPDNSRLSSERT